MNVDQIRALPHHTRLIIPDDYLDIFNHMNVQYYLRIFNDSVFMMLEEMGMDASYFHDNQVGFYAVDQRLSYKAEVKEGETVSTYSRLIARSDKRLHFMAFIVNDSQNILSATMEALAFYIDKNSKRSTHFPDSVAQVLDERLNIDQNLDWSVPLSQAIQVGKK